MRPHEEDPSWFTLTRPTEEPIVEATQSPGSQDYLIPLPSSCSLATVRSELNSSPSLDSPAGPDVCQMERLLEEEDSGPPPPISPPHWETSFTTEPVNAPTPPILPVTTPLLISPPNSPSPTPLSQSTPAPQDTQHLTPSHEPSVMIPMQPMGASVSSSPGPPNQGTPNPGNSAPSAGSGSSSNSNGASKRQQHYHPHRFSNSGSSNNSSSSGGSSCTGSNSISSNSSGVGSSNSSVSTLPLDASTLPCTSAIPPPLAYVNVDVTKRSPEYNEAYVIHETREHREISC